MKSPFFSSLLVACLGVADLPSAQAQDRTPPVVARPIADIVVDAGAPPRLVRVGNTFALEGVGKKVVRFKTSLGNIDVELLAGSAPKTVANFMRYVNRGEALHGGYNYTIIEQSIPGHFLQGGGFYVADSGIVALPAQTPVASEAGIMNTTGTLAMALSTGPDSATDEWFFNLTDNTSGDYNLDGSTFPGPYTVFGRVIEDGMMTIDAIAALKIYNLSASVVSDISNSFNSVPLLSSYNSSIGATPTDLVYTESIATIPLVATGAGGPALLTLKVLKNTRPGLVTATLKGRELELTFLDGRRGEARITLQARDVAGAQVRTSFTVTVR